MSDLVLSVKTRTGDIQTRQLPWSWLVLDLSSWAKDTAERMADLTDSSAPSDEDIEIETSETALADAEEIQITPDDAIQFWPDLRLRSVFWPSPTVTADDLDTFVDRLLDYGQKYRDTDGEDIQCLLLVDERLLLSSNRVVARYTGADIHGEHLSGEFLRHRFLRVRDGG